MENKSVDKLHAEKRAELKKSKPVAPRSGAPAARVLDAIERGDALGVIKPFKSGEVLYQAGDKIEANVIPAASAAQLAEHEYLLPMAELEAGVVFEAKRKHFVNVLEPQYTYVSQHRTAAISAAQVVRDRERALEAAREALELAEQRLAEQEEVYRRLLTGDST